MNHQSTKLSFWKMFLEKHQNSGYFEIGFRMDIGLWLRIIIVSLLFQWSDKYFSKSLLRRSRCDFSYFLWHSTNANIFRAFDKGISAEISPETNHSIDSGISKNASTWHLFTVHGERSGEVTYMLLVDLETYVPLKLLLQQELFFHLCMSFFLYKHHRIHLEREQHFLN